MTKNERKQRRSERRRSAMIRIGIYLDDLLLLGGGACFVAAAWAWRGYAAALTVAGAWLTIYAILVARAARKR